MTPFLLTLAQVLLVVLLSPLTVGIIRKVKARFQNRRGASIFQPYWTLLVLCRKEMTITKQSSWVFRAVPFVVLASALALAVLVPTVGVGSWGAMHGNVFLVAAVLVIGSLFLVFGGMDVASAFGGMGSSREMTLAALVEPSVIVTFATLGLMAASWNLDGILAFAANAPWYPAHPFFFLTLLSLACVVLAENARYPVDNPATHLELTMVHEAMILEYSGPYLAMLEGASAIKLTVLGTLFVSLLFPTTIIAVTGLGALALAVLALIVKIVVVGILVACVESLLVKMRFYRMQEYMTVAYFLGLAGLLLSLVF